MAPAHESPSLLPLAMMMMMMLVMQVRPQEFKLDDALDAANAQTTPTPLPGTKAPVKPKGKPAAGEFDLADALDPNNDITTTNKGKGGRPAGGFSDNDLIDVSNDNSYKPDKGKGGRPSGERDHVNQHDDNIGTTAEVGTIAGIVSAVGMALVGAISSYISYQKKKLCFGIQQSLNAEMVKADAPDSVLATEPQVQQTLLDHASAEPGHGRNVV
ncbi:CD99 antigen-like protein 2 isoform X1 [Syngnathus scovelli]|uniref:CD99 antigen-like protein 2 isoform X1 n=1 Tax=Syngnathus scovelli TaxID=161590 RepID=UPI00210F5543|nr:CD99 antigen-like protein 2 isoform X1 [Syngnathus scovelli]